MSVSMRIRNDTHTHTCTHQRMLPPPPPPLCLSLSNAHLLHKHTCVQIGQFASPTHPPTTPGQNHSPLMCILQRRWFVLRYVVERRHGIHVEQRRFAFSCAGKHRVTHRGSKEPRCNQLTKSNKFRMCSPPDRVQSSLSNPALVYPAPLQTSTLSGKTDFFSSFSTL